MKPRILTEIGFALVLIFQLTGCAVSYQMKELEVTVLDHETQKPVPHVLLRRVFDPFNGHEYHFFHGMAFSQSGDYETEDDGKCDLELPITYDFWLELENPKNEYEKVKYHFKLNGYPIGDFKYIKPGESRTVNGVTYNCFHHIEHLDRETWKLSYEKIPFEKDHSTFDVRIREKIKNKDGE